MVARALRPVSWLIVVALTAVILVRAAADQGNDAWLICLWLIYIGVVVLTTLADSNWSQGPPGPIPPETYT